jgi:CubicO group peptidase (beta-lactamase class C family)
VRQTDPEDAYRIVPAAREITIRDLLTHTSGITYRFFGRPFLDKFYTAANISDGLVQTEGTVAENIDRLAALPLKHQPGTAWEYGLSTDVLGRVVEAASGLPLDRFFRQRILDPLGMHDTHFFLPAGKRWRLAAVYTPADDGTVNRHGEDIVREESLIYSVTVPYDGPTTYFSGGAGLVSTAPDYYRFCQMLLNEGELEGVRILKPETVALMTRNQIGDLEPFWPVHGNRFGYGFGVFTEGHETDRGEAPGTYSWGGFYYTDFWIDPEHELIGILMTQVYPSKLTLREDFRRAVYQALAD